MKDRLLLATRKSPLAMSQAEQAAAYLRNLHPGCSVELLPMSTTGDKQANWSLSQKGGKGLFTKELEDALMKNEADIAVHSAKDLPSRQPEGLAIAGYLPRGPVEDVLVIREGISSPKVIATGSPRRRAQAKRLFPSAVWKDLRGKVETRLAKISRGDADATLLAKAGLERLGINDFEGLTFKSLELDEMIPAAGQGAIALEVRETDRALFAKQFDKKTAYAVTLEKAVLAGMGEGCHTSLGVYYNDGRLHVFQEKQGQKSYELSSIDLKKALARIDEIVEALKIAD